MSNQYLAPLFFHVITIHSPSHISCWCRPARRSCGEGRRRAPVRNRPPIFHASWRGRTPRRINFECLCVHVLLFALAIARARWAERSLAHERSAALSRQYPAELSIFQRSFRLCSLLPNTKHGQRQVAGAWAGRVGVRRRDAKRKILPRPQPAARPRNSRESRRFGSVSAAQMAPAHKRTHFVTSSGTASSRSRSEGSNFKLRASHATFAMFVGQDHE